MKAGCHKSICGDTDNLCLSYFDFLNVFLYFLRDINVLFLFFYFFQRAPVVSRTLRNYFIISGMDYFF